MPSLLICHLCIVQATQASHKLDNSNNLQKTLKDKKQRKSLNAYPSFGVMGWLREAQPWLAQTASLPIGVVVCPLRLFELSIHVDKTHDPDDAG